MREPRTPGRRLRSRETIGTLIVGVVLGAGVARYSCDGARSADTSLLTHGLPTTSATGSSPAPTVGVTPTSRSTFTSETVGDPLETWSNYMTAGGSEGPAIGKLLTVAVACKLNGFRVADGDTWWYRISSKPWSNNFYASADGFYNNSQKSGTLRGTPYVDPVIPDC